MDDAHWNNCAICGEVSRSLVHSECSRKYRGKEGHYCDGGFSMGGTSTSFWTDIPMEECYCRNKPFQELPGDHH